MKNQALFSSKDKSKKSKCRLLQFLFVALRVNMFYHIALRMVKTPEIWPFECNRVNI